MKRLALAICLLVPAVARAQGTGTAAQSCDGDMLKSTIGIQVFQQGAYSTIQPGSTSRAFANAECYCATTDLQFILRATQQFSANSRPNAQIEVWVGNNCDNYTNRSTSTQTACEKIPVDINIQKLTQFGSDGDVIFSIPAASLMSPAPTPQTSGVHTCTMSNPSAKIYFFVIDGDPMTPIVSCPLQANGIITNLPPPPAGLAATGGDKAVQLSWNAAPAGGIVPFSYQVLCADAAGNPIAGKVKDAAYTSCQADGIHRKILVTNASSSTTTTDGGTTTTGDGGTGRLGDDPAPPSFPNADDGGADDGGVDGGTAAPMNPGVTTTNLPAPFTNLDPAYICSGEMISNGGDGSTRIDGLNNNEVYQFVVVAIDLYGNPVPSEVITAIPTPVEDLYTRYYNKGGKASGFCFIATAAFGSYEHRFVRVLRDFRDRVLLPTSLGARFVDWYYAHSPPLAAYIEQHRWARLATQTVLWPVIGIAALIVYPSTAAHLAMLAAVALFLARKRIRRALRQPAVAA